MTLLDGKKVSKEKLESLKEKISKLNRKLGLAIIKIGNDKSSEIYVNNKKKKAEELNYNCTIITLDEKSTEEKVIEKIDKLNKDNTIDGIIIELPIPNHLNKEKILNSIIKEKDIDGLTLTNRENLEKNKPYLVPCTPLAILDLLDYYNISLKNKKITIIGKSILVGTPLYNILKNKHLKVNLLDSKTKNIEKTKLILIIAGRSGCRSTTTAMRSS